MTTDNTNTPILEHATIPALDGEWLVIGIGWAKPMDLLGDRKHISGRAGHNVMLGSVQWGWFRVDGDGPSYTLNYDDPRNPAGLTTVRDVIEPDEHGWVGTLYQDNKPRFRFRLRRLTRTL